MTIDISAVKAVLFDLDGTLVDTLDGLTELVNQMRGDFDKPPLKKEVVGTFIGKGMSVLIRRSLVNSTDYQTHPLSDAIFDLAVTSMKRHIDAGKYNKGTAYPDARSSVLRIKEAGYKVALVTNKPYAMTLVSLKEAGLEGLFEVIIGGDTAAHPKPYPDPLLLACQKLGVEPTNAIMVGDSGNDTGSALAASMPSILLTTGWNEGISLEEIVKRDKVGAIFSRMSQVADFLLGDETLKKRTEK